MATIHNSWHTPIPFNAPFIVGKELHYIAQAIKSNKIVGDGCFTRQCTRYLEERFGIHKVLMTPSCTAARGRTFGYREGDLPVTEDASFRLLRLPAYAGITEAEQARVVSHIVES